MLVMKNKGLIPEAAIDTMGVSAKVTDNPIGQFGTGLKYTIAIVLRTGGEITIWRGLKKLSFSVKTEQIRGEQFDIVRMNGRRLGFTTRLGLNWEPWMAYREVASNTKDEGGTIHLIDDESDIPPPDKKETLIVIRHPEMEQAHTERHRIFLQTEPVYTLEGISVHPGESEFVYYRGIRVSKLQKKSMFTYNITRPMQLTEDRTLLYPHMISYFLIRDIMTCGSDRFLMTVLSNDHTKSYMENTLSYSGHRDTRPSDQFLHVAEILREAKDLVGVVTATHDYWLDQLGRTTSPADVVLMPADIDNLEKALEEVRRVGVDLPADAIRFRPKLALGETQTAGSRMILIDAGYLQKNRKQLASAILKGAAMLAGGATAHQLAYRMLYGEWDDPQRSIDIGDLANSDHEFVF